MLIGQYVREHIKQIFDYCEGNPNELEHLLDRRESKEIFGLNYPFCIEVKNIDERERTRKHRRYWVQVYSVRGKEVRVTNEWYEPKHRQTFISYLRLKKIPLETKTP